MLKVVTETYLDQEQHPKNLLSWMQQKSSHEKDSQSHDFDRRTYPALEHRVDCFKAAAIKLCLLSFRATVLCKKETWLSIAARENTEQGDAS